MTQPGMAMAPAAQAPIMPDVGGLSSAAGVPTTGNDSNVAGTTSGMDGALAQAFGQDAAQTLSNVTLPPGYDQTTISSDEVTAISMGEVLNRSLTGVGAAGGVAAKSGLAQAATNTRAGQAVAEAGKAAAVKGKAAAGSLSKAVATNANRMAVSSVGKRVAASAAGRAVAGFGARLAARAAITAPLNAVPFAGQVAYVAVMVGLILNDPLIRRGIRALFGKPNVNIDSPPTPPNQFLPMWGNRTDDDIMAQDANLVNANNSMFSFDPARVGPNKDRVDPSSEIVQAAKLEELAAMADNANSHYDSTVAELSNVLNKYMGEQYVERTAQLATPLISAMQDAPQKAILPSLQGLVNAGMGINEAYVGFHEVIMKTREEIVNSGDGFVPFYRTISPEKFGELDTVLSSASQSLGEADQMLRGAMSWAPPSDAIQNFSPAQSGSNPSAGEPGEQDKNRNTPNVTSPGGIPRNPGSSRGPSRLPGRDRDRDNDREKDRNNEGNRDEGKSREEQVNDIVDQLQKAAAPVQDQIQGNIDTLNGMNPLNPDSVNNPLNPNNALFGNQGMLNPNNPNGLLNPNNPNGILGALRNQLNPNLSSPTAGPPGSTLDALKKQSPETGDLKKKLDDIIKNRKEATPPPRTAGPKVSAPKADDKVDGKPENKDEEKEAEKVEVPAEQGAKETPAPAPNVLDDINNPANPEGAEDIPMTEADAPEGDGDGMLSDPEAKVADEGTTEVKRGNDTFDLKSPDAAKLANLINPENAEISPKPLVDAAKEAGYVIPDHPAPIGESVSPADIKPGDVVIGSGDEGIYVGDGKVLTADGVEPLTSMASFEEAGDGIFRLEHGENVPDAGGSTDVPDSPDPTPAPDLPSGMDTGSSAGDSPAASDSNGPSGLGSAQFLPEDSGSSLTDEPSVGDSPTTTDETFTASTADSEAAGAAASVSGKDNPKTLGNIPVGD